MGVGSGVGVALGRGVEVGRGVRIGSGVNVGLEVSVGVLAACVSDKAVWIALSEGAAGAQALNITDATNRGSRDS
jgi:hypothetical protein